MSGVRRERELTPASAAALQAQREIFESIGGAPQDARLKAADATMEPLKVTARTEVNPFKKGPKPKRYDRTLSDDSLWGDTFTPPRPRISLTAAEFCGRRNDSPGCNRFFRGECSIILPDEVDIVLKTGVCNTARVGARSGIMRREGFQPYPEYISRWAY